jgi:hypothetical protein
MTKSLRKLTCAGHGIQQLRYLCINGCDLRTNFVANQAVSSAGMISGWDQFRRMVAGGL